MDWKDFKRLVKQMRRFNKELIRSQGGSNRVTVDICLIDMSIRDWVYVNPFSVNLKTGKGTINSQGKYLFDFDIKELVGRSIE